MSASQGPTAGQVLDEKLANKTLEGLQSFAFMAAQVDPAIFEQTVTAVRVSRFLSNTAEFLASQAKPDDKRQAVRAVLEFMKTGRTRSSEEVKTAMVGRSLDAIHAFIAGNNGFLTEFATYRDIYPSVATMVGPVVPKKVDCKLVEVKMAGNREPVAAK